MNDIVIAGSGINALMAAAILARKGRKVCVLERSDRVGGCMRTEEITVPGFKHDVMATVFPLLLTSPGYEMLAKDLAAHGLNLLHFEYPTGVIMPDGRTAVMHMDRGKNVEEFNSLAGGDGDAFARSMDSIGANAPLLFTALGSELKRWKTLATLAMIARKMGFANVLKFIGGNMESCRTWLTRDFNSEVSRALLAPWALHGGQGPDDAMSALMGKLIPFTLEQAGTPVAEGGAGQAAAAFRSYVESQGGEFHVNTDVDDVIIEGNRAVGVRTANGEEFRAAKAVIASMTPTQLYGRLLRNADIPREVRREAADFRYGRGDMQIHLALDEKPNWPDDRLLECGMFHITPGLDAISKAVNEAERGLLPESATVVVTQQAAVDSTRVPEGKWLIWIQLQEIPTMLKGDAAGQIEIPADGRWNDAVKEAYADRIVDLVAAHAPNLKQSILARTVISPADLENLNINLVNGDPYSGAVTIDQNLVWRPLKSTANHNTPVKALYHIGASTHPGSGLGGGSGLMVSQYL